ncbi:MAG: TonB-dependent receptor [Candidatus Marinimicrobia bacterium]|nr:TonB-dependent receptor [Candidatus Neomarinimicrobiota bacterium]
MNTRRLLFNLFGLIILTTIVFGQRTEGMRQMPSIGVLQGTVLDSSNKRPIEYASVSLIHQRTEEITTGGLTGKKGDFYIKEIPLGRYNVVIEFIGYKPSKIIPIALSPRGEGIEQNLGNIYLVATSLEMDQVDVEGERPMFTQTVEKKIFNVEQNTLSTGGSALDVLRQIPGVDVDIDGNISVRGNSNVNILLDGKPSSMTSGDSEMLLENIPADNIQDIEVLTNPSAKYDPDGMAGIINIVLKENKFAGLNGNINAGISSNSSTNGSGQINFRNEKVNIFVNSGFRKNIRGASGETHKEIFSPDTVILDQSVSGDRGGESLLLKSGIEYYIDRKSSIGFTASMNKRIHDHNRRVDTIEQDSVITEYYRLSDHSNDRAALDYTLTYDRKFSNPKQTLSVVTNFSNGSSTSNDNQLSYPIIEYDSFDPIPEKSSQKRKDTDLNIQADYVHPFGEKGKIEAGYKGIIDEMDTDYKTYGYDETTESFILDTARSNHFIFEENIQSGYLQMNNQSGNIGYQLGIRAETATNLSQLLDTDQNFENPYTSYFPSASLSFGPPKLFQIQASYSRRIRRPSSRHLNPSIQQFDQTSMRTGNPFLKPEYIDVSELNFSWYKNGLSLSLGAYYRNVTDKISRHKYSTEEGMTIVTYENYDNKQSYGTEFILSGSLGKKLRLMASGNVYTDETKASGLTDNDIVHTSTGFNSRITTTWMISPATEMMFMGFYRSPRDLPYGEMKSMSFSSISFKQKFAKDRFSVSLRLNDIFNTMGFGYKTFDEFYFQESERKFDSQIASLTLEYHFGSMEDKSRGNKRKTDSNGNGGDDYDIE